MIRLGYTLQLGVVRDLIRMRDVVLGERIDGIGFGVEVVQFS